MNELLPFLKDSVCWYVVFYDRHKQKLFRAERDYEYYLRLLKKFKRIYQVHLFAFCLLPMNIQLILQPRHADQLSPFLQNVNECYQLFFNARYEPVEDLELYQNKNVFIDNDQGLLDRIKYVECSSMGNLISTALGSYPWSSCFHRIDSETQILDKTPFPETFLKRSQSLSPQREDHENRQYRSIK